MFTKNTILLKIIVLTDCLLGYCFYTWQCLGKVN